MIFHPIRVYGIADPLFIFIFMRIFYTKSGFVYSKYYYVVWSDEFYNESISKTFIKIFEIFNQKVLF